jgi:hypothetical protein
MLPIWAILLIDAAIFIFLSGAVGICMSIRHRRYESMIQDIRKQNTEYAREHPEDPRPIPEPREW